MGTKQEHLYRGRLHSVRGEHKEATEEYKKALEIDPSYEPAKANLGLISYMKGPSGKDSTTSRKGRKDKRIWKQNRKDWTRAVCK